MAFSLRGGFRKFTRDQRAALGALNTSIISTIVVVIITAVLGMAVLNGLLPSFFTSTQGVVGTLSSATVGNATANSLMPTFGLLAAIVAVLSVVSLTLFVLKIRRSG